ncbi:L,D-transpeptidase [Synechococcus sp. PROS-9-1]|uniref:L,D-transpeptidase n=1 Tax=Synechococcus sp. PROS-9-1 TaxID=1968775 RepID=UPI00351CAF17
MAMPAALLAASLLVGTVGVASAQEVGGNRTREVKGEILVEAPEEGPEEDPKRKSDPIPPLAMPVSDAASLARVPSDVMERDGLQLVIDRKHHQLLVLRDGRMTRRYPAAVGTTGWETPAGRFRVFEKVKEPVWTHPVSGELVEAESEKTRWDHAGLASTATAMDALVGTASNT